MKLALLKSLSLVMLLVLSACSGPSKLTLSSVNGNGGNACTVVIYQLTGDHHFNLAKQSELSSGTLATETLGDELIGIPQRTVVRPNEPARVLEIKFEKGAEWIGIVANFNSESTRWKTILRADDVSGKELSIRIDGYNLVVD